MESERTITIFGSSRAKGDSEAYAEAYQLGKLLAESGFTVCNGGYGGIMEASARGAKEAGGKTVGVTTAVFKNSSPNSWIDINTQTESSIQRLMAMTSSGDAFVMLRGGIGTLAEMTFVWASATARELRKPIILVGNSWQRIIDALSEHLSITCRDTEVLIMVDSAKEAAEELLKTFE
ncbi:LOG family protein [Candidatus Poribacteria bacterium]